MHVIEDRLLRIDYYWLRQRRIERGRKIVVVIVVWYRYSILVKSTKYPS